MVMGILAGIAFVEVLIIVLLSWTFAMTIKVLDRKIKDQQKANEVLLNQCTALRKTLFNVSDRDKK